MKRSCRILGVALLVLLSSCASGDRMSKRGEYARLEIRHASQSTNLCLPTSASMVMNYYGENHSQWSLKAATQGHKDLFSGTSFEEIVESARRLGYEWKLAAYRDDSDGFEKGLVEIKRQLDRGHPPILGLFWRHDADQSFYTPRPGDPVMLNRRNMGHAVVLYGYDENSHDVFIVDPAEEFPGRWHCSYDELRTLWTTSEARVRVIMCTSPPRRKSAENGEK